MALIKRPTNVHICHPDGTTTLLELAYKGQDSDGIHRWESFTAMQSGDELHADTLPPRTEVWIPQESDD